MWTNSIFIHHRTHTLVMLRVFFGWWLCLTCERRKMVAYDGVPQQQQKSFQGFSRSDFFSPLHSLVLVAPRIFSTVAFDTHSQIFQLIFMRPWSAIPLFSKEFRLLLFFLPFSSFSLGAIKLSLHFSSLFFSRL